MEVSSFEFPETFAFVLQYSQINLEVKVPHTNSTKQTKYTTNYVTNSRDQSSIQGKHSPMWNHMAAKTQLIIISLQTPPELLFSAVSCVVSCHPCGRLRFSAICLWRTPYMPLIPYIWFHMWNIYIPYIGITRSMHYLLQMVGHIMLKVR